METITISKAEYNLLTYRNKLLGELMESAVMKALYDVTQSYMWIHTKAKSV